jgi:hypothetical protein
MKLGPEIFFNFISSKADTLINKIELFNQILLPYIQKSTTFYSYIGINYNKESVLSFKCYYVFFDQSLFNHGFPIGNLEQLYYSNIKYASPHVSNFRSSGGGITLTIKFDEEINTSIGFYLRQNKNNTPFVSNIISQYPDLFLEKTDFEPGYGNYVMFKNDIIEESQYVYLNNVNKLHSLANLSGIDYSNARSIEISSSNKSNFFNHKFIALGGPELIENSFDKNIPLDFPKIIRELGAKLICPSTNWHNDTFSCYAYLGNSNLVSSFCEWLKTASQRAI